MSTDLLARAAARIREVSGNATEGPWWGNGYSAVFSRDGGHDEWQDVQVDAGHTLEGHPGAVECPTCGPWTWDYTNPKTGEVSVYNGRGCRLYTEDYKRDPQVAYVPSHHGDTAIGRHAADAAHIALADPGVMLAVADWLDSMLPYHEHCDLPDDPCIDISPALAVARAVLGETP
jgi:hypothetical protein